MRAPSPAALPPGQHARKDALAEPDAPAREEGVEAGDVCAARGRSPGAPAKPGGVGGGGWVDSMTTRSILVLSLSRSPRVVVRELAVTEQGRVPPVGQYGHASARVDGIADRSRFSS